MASLHGLSEQRFASAVEDNGVFKEYRIENEQQILQAHIRASQRNTPSMSLLNNTLFLADNIRKLPC